MRPNAIEYIVIRLWGRVIEQALKMYDYATNALSDGRRAYSIKTASLHGKVEGDPWGVIPKNLHRAPFWDGVLSSRVHKLLWFLVRSISHRSAGFNNKPVYLSKN